MLKSCLAFVLAVPSTLAALSCPSEILLGDSDAFCEAKIGPGSKCIEGLQTCSNIYTQGCLRSKLGDDYPIRVCNTDDGEGAAEKEGLCLESMFNYTEIRIHHSNWESSIFYAWILQILLSERLGVPVTIGMGPDTSLNSFYSDQNTLQYSPVVYPFEALEEANRVGGDCKLSDKECVHVLPEVWNGAAKSYTAALLQGHIDPPEGDGQVGKGSWYVPSLTAQRHKELVSYHGLGGEDMPREKLAKVFKRPTTWKIYCDEVSTTQCAQLDDVASRYPEPEEETSYFAGEGVYIGHFRATEENDCIANPDTCTGHIVAPPCTWSSFIDSQSYWNNIPVSSSGPNDPNGSYSYGSMVQIYNAANVTKSDVLMWWWTPEPFIEEFRGTDYEFQQVLLPATTGTCKRARITADACCSLDETERRGKVEGSCDSEAHALQKVIASSLGKSTLAYPAVHRSPGYATVRSFKIDNLDMNEILFKWLQMGVDQYGHDAREVVCSWVAENIDALDQFIPSGYPREISMESTYDQPFLLAAQILGALATGFVLCVGMLVYWRRRTRVFVFAQVYFVLLLTCGFFLVTVAAMVSVIEPSTTVCVGTVWLVTLGYTLELVPLLVKIATLNTLVQSARRMKRLRISRKTMLAKVVVVMTAVALYLAIWTIVDPPTQVEERVLVEETGTMVEASLSCSSKSYYWKMIAEGWQGLLLLMALVLAFQTRNLQQEFNESRSLCIMVYSHFIFMVLRVTVEVLEESATFGPTFSSGATSYLLTFDVISAICIYIVPKLLASSRDPEPYQPGSSGSCISAPSALLGMLSHGLISGIPPSSANSAQMLMKKDHCSVDEDLSTSFVEEEDGFVDRRLRLKSLSIRFESDVSGCIEEEEEPQVKNQHPESAIDYDGGAKLEMDEAASLISGITPSPANSSQMAFVKKDQFSSDEDLTG